MPQSSRHTVFVLLYWSQGRFGPLQYAPQHLVTHMWPYVTWLWQWFLKAFILQWYLWLIVEYLGGLKFHKLSSCNDGFLLYHHTSNSASSLQQLIHNYLWRQIALLGAGIQRLKWYDPILLPIRCICCSKQKIHAFCSDWWLWGCML